MIPFFFCICCSSDPAARFPRVARQLAPPHVLHQGKNDKVLRNQDAPFTSFLNLLCCSSNPATVYPLRVRSKVRMVSRWDPSRSFTHSWNYLCRSWNPRQVTPRRRGAVSLCCSSNPAARLSNVAPETRNIVPSPKPQRECLHYGSSLDGEDGTGGSLARRQCCASFVLATSKYGIAYVCFVPCRKPTLCLGIPIFLFRCTLPMLLPYILRVHGHKECMTPFHGIEDMSI